MDMNDLYQRLPLMPAVLGPHDVWVEDWIRCVEASPRVNINFHASHASPLEKLSYIYDATLHAHVGAIITSLH